LSRKAERERGINEKNEIKAKIFFGTEYKNLKKKKKKTRRENVGKWESAWRENEKKWRTRALSRTTIGRLREVLINESLI